MFFLLVKVAIIAVLFTPATALSKHPDILSSFDNVNVPLLLSDKIQSAEHWAICTRDKPTPIHAKSIIVNWNRGHWIEIRGRNHRDLTLRAVRGNLYLEDYIPKQGKWVSERDAIPEELEANLKVSRFTYEGKRFLDRCIDRKLKVFEEKRATENLKQSLRKNEDLVRTLEKIRRELTMVIEKLNQ